MQLLVKIETEEISIKQMQLEEEELKIISLIQLTIKQMQLEEEELKIDMVRDLGLNKIKPRLESMDHLKTQEVIKVMKIEV